jgi:hypothetical protein
MLLQPWNIALLSVFLDRAQERHRLGLIARFAGVIWWNDHFDVDGDDESIGVDQPRPFDALAGNAHD